MTNTRVRRAATVASMLWMGVIFWLSSLTGSTVPSRYSTLGHFSVYAVLGALYLLALPREMPVGRRILIAVALASLYGVSDEFHQSFVPGRTPDPADWAMDTIGALTGASAAMVVIHQASTSRLGPRGRGKAVRTRQ